MPHEIVLDATTGRTTDLHRFSLSWTAEAGFDLRPPASVPGLRSPGVLATAEHVQCVFEDAGYRLEAASFHALFNLDDKIRWTEDKPFLVRDPGSGRVGLCTTAGALLGSPIELDRNTRLSLATAARLFEIAAPIGIRALNPPWVSEHEAAAELTRFTRAVDQVWSRQGVLSVRDMQDWAMARASGHTRIESRATTRLQAGASGFFGMVRLAVAISLVRDHPRQAGQEHRPTLRRSASAALPAAGLQV